MITEEQYQLCRPVLENESVGEEEKIEQMEEILSGQTSLKGPALENAILDALWRQRSAAKGEDTPLRHTVIRKQSPAPWQMNRSPTPMASPPPSSSPALSSAFPSQRPSFSRQRSAASPFASPRPSPRIALAQPIPHSPNLNAYEFSNPSPAPDIYGDFGSDAVDWLVGDDTVSNASSTGLSAAAPEWMPQSDMSPYDILRSVLGDKLSDDQIEKSLEEHSFDLSTTIAALLGSDVADAHSVAAAAPTSGETNVIVGKSMATTQTRPATPGSNKSTIVCKYWLASGSCLRADCRFAHDTSNHLCKYWMNGQCLAGESCQFSHDPALLVNQLNLNESSALNASAPVFQYQEHSEQFPALSSSTSRGGSSYTSSSGGYFPSVSVAQQRTRGGLVSRPHSRPNSRHQNRPETPSSLSVDDPEAFPSLGSLSAKRNSKHHGHRSRHTHSAADKDVPSSLADVVKMSPSPAPAQLRKSELARKIRPSGAGSNFASTKIPEPQHIPWLETGTRANQQYLKHRQEAIRHGSIRNKFLQSAAQAWNRNDARAAKALSLRGQAENEAMRKAHREAAKALYEERNKHLANRGAEDEQDETYVDLHGLHPEEAIEYLEDILVEHANRDRTVVYAITGTGHHSKNGKDKVGKGVRNWLNEWGYTYREFSVPGERGGYVGGVLGIDCSSHRNEPRSHGSSDDLATPPATAVGGKIQLLRRE